MFASRTQQTIALPFDEGQTVTIQKLAGRQLEKAKEANQVASIESLKRLGGPAFQDELGKLGDPVKTAELVAKAQADPFFAYDIDVLLYKGIKAWTYPESLTPVDVVDDDGKTVRRIVAIDDLDDVAREFLSRAILQLTKPELFATAEDAQKKADPSPSLA